MTNFNIKNQTLIRLYSFVTDNTMENIKLLFLLYIRPAFAMSEILDKGSWLFSVVLVLFISIAFYWTVNARLQSAYSIPAFYEYYNPDYKTIGKDSPEFQAARRNAESA